MKIYENILIMWKEKTEMTNKHFNIIWIKIIGYQLTFFFYSCSLNIKKIRVSIWFLLIWENCWEALRVIDIFKHETSLFKYICILQCYKTLSIIFSVTFKNINFIIVTFALYILIVTTYPAIKKVLIPVRLCL